MEQVYKYFLFHILVVKQASSHNFFFLYYVFYNKQVLHCNTDYLDENVKDYLDENVKCNQVNVNAVALLILLTSFLFPKNSSRFSNHSILMYTESFILLTLGIHKPRCLVSNFLKMP